MALRRACWYYNVRGLVKYPYALEWQRQLRLERMVGDGLQLPDALLLLEHEPIYTLGSKSTEKFIKFDLTNPPCEVHRISRGGEVTYHGPGQVVGYPVINLRHHRQDLRWYLRSLEGVLITTLRRYGLDATRKEGLTGVWYGNSKLAAIGVGASKWVTMHGFALNVKENVEAFGRIVPCGIEDEDKRVGALEEFVPDVSVEEVKHHLVECFAEQFNLDMVPFEPGRETQASNTAPTMR